MSPPFVDAVQHEVAEEKAGALGRSGRRLEHALERFRTYERNRAGSHAARAADRDRLLWELAERVEAFVVQREACGLRDSRHVLAYYGVPREAIARVGAARAERTSWGRPSAPLEPVHAPEGAELSDEGRAVRLQHPAQDRHGHALRRDRR